MKAETKTGEIEITNTKVILRRIGLIGAWAEFNSMLLSPVYRLFGVNTDKEIDISKNKKVEFNYGVPHIIKPHMKIYYDKKKPRLVIFKRAISDIANYEKGVSEMEKILSEFKRRNISLSEMKQD